MSANQGLKADFINKILPLVEAYTQATGNDTCFRIFPDVVSDDLNKIIERMTPALRLRGQQRIVLVKTTERARDLALWEIENGKPLSFNIASQMEKPPESLRFLFNTRTIDLGKAVEDAIALDRMTIVLQDEIPTHHIFFTEPPESDLEDDSLSFENIWGSISVYGSSIAKWAKQQGVSQSVMDLSKYPSTHMVRDYEDYVFVKPKNNGDKDEKTSKSRS